MDFCVFINNNSAILIMAGIMPCFNENAMNTSRESGIDIVPMAINSADYCNNPAGERNPNLQSSKLWLIETFVTGSVRPIPDI